VVFINTLTLCNVVDLVFIQNATLLEIKVVTRRVITGRVNNPGSYLGLSGTVQEKAPVLVFLTWIQIFKKIFQG